MKKRLFAGLLAGLLMLSACSASPAQETGFSVAATTYPIYLLAREVTAGVEGVTVTPVVNQSVSCLHDYTLTIPNMKAIEQADLLLLNGVGLEDFMDDALEGRSYVDCSAGIALLESGEEDHDHDHDHEGHSAHDGHDHGEHDPHIWMDPGRAAQMAETIAAGLAEADPDHAEAYLANGQAVAEELTSLKSDLNQQLEVLTCRELITFHDGFAYFADAFGLDILAAIEEEEGSEASAKDIVEIVGYVKEYHLPSIFVEANGSDATANAISRECGVAVHTLSMLMSGPTDDLSVTYSSLMRENINALLEALS